MMPGAHACADALLGGLLLDETGETAARELPFLLGVVRADDFHGDHRTIFAAIERLHAAGKLVTPATVETTIGRGRRFRLHGWRLSTAERLICLGPAASNLRWYADKLVDARRTVGNR